MFCRFNGSMWPHDARIIKDNYPLWVQNSIIVLWYAVKCSLLTPLLNILYWYAKYFLTMTESQSALPCYYLYIYKNVPSVVLNNNVQKQREQFFIPLCRTLLLYAQWMMYTYIANIFCKIFAVNDMWASVTTSRWCHARPRWRGQDGGSSQEDSNYIYIGIIDTTT